MFMIISYYDDVISKVNISTYHQPTERIASWLHLYKNFVEHTTSQSISKEESTHPLYIIFIDEINYIIHYIK